jgi:hypothetical protein
MLARQIVESHYDMFIRDSTGHDSTERISDAKKRVMDEKKREHTANRAKFYLGHGEFLKNEAMDAQVNASAVF